MPYSSPLPRIDIPKCNILSYLFPPDKPVPPRPQWIDAADSSHSLSAAQMLSWVKRFAMGLDRLGVREQETIMVFSPNHLYVPMAYLAAAGSKRVFTGANPIYTAAEVAHQMKAISAAVVLVHPLLLETGVAAATQAGIPLDRVFLFSAEHPPKTTANSAVRDWRTMVASEAEAQSWQWDTLERNNAAEKTIAAINFSSGTTGLPKGVCITHHNLIANASQCIFARFWGIDNPPPERWLAFLPLYHAYSQLWTINIACKLQIPVYVMEKFVFEDFLAYIQKYKITSLQLVPPVLVMLTKRPETNKYDLSSLKSAMCGAAPLSSELQNEVLRRFNIVVVQGWGMTETTCGGIIMPGVQADHTGSIGYLLPNTEAKLVDEDGREVTKEGEPGELWVRGPQMLLGYWRNEQATKESKTDDGWFKTGDVAVCKGQKFWIVDRKKELIKVNGLQVAPAELEAVLLENPDVADAAVVGVVVHGEELPRAYVVLQETAKRKGTTEQDIKDFVAARVAKHKRLEGGVKFIDEVPKLASGKIVRKLMKEWAKRDAKEVERTVKPRL
ncbi:Phenylacetyl-CoA ligase epaB [Exophiala dermatitidis]|uniref:4-coumarate-CoA ligase n=1 Tax=Exophiala dermatitidis (strain ATCC 34100 / CBS 525.76 / NIH/UT8656) TaxID=858893 RepID=H6BKG4_EXODN|nr:4-coumarate-CoA ligase [Exophiala dermatitidis NIH/UT8656]EHY52598.1 4-coumarate-CoA ligase [Exophiala dermatitidis NIH/UT8656]